MKRGVAGELRTLGITGGIGAGKTTLCRILVDRYQLPWIDADALGHEALQPGSTVYEALVARFGEGALDPAGRLSRSRLADRVFRDPAALRDLNGLVHPWILERIEARLAALKASGHRGIILVDAALLPSWLDRFRPDGIAVVTAPLEVRLARLEERGLDREEARRRIESQEAEASWTSRADWIVENTGSLADLAAKARSLFESARSRWKLGGTGGPDAGRP